MDKLNHLILYEEIALLTPVALLPNLPQLLYSQTYPGYSNLNIENNDTSVDPKTLNTKTDTRNDDKHGCFSILNEKLDAAVRRITGDAPSKLEAEKWGILADLLILELEVAAGKAGSISSVPAFLTEVLRRQFFTSRRRQPTAKQSKVKKDTVGKIETENYEIKPLDEKGRERALEQLREFAGEDFLEDFRKWYTTEDWEWIIKQLGFR